MTVQQSNVDEMFDLLQEVFLYRGILFHNFTLSFISLFKTGSAHFHSLIFGLFCVFIHINHLFRASNCCILNASCDNNCKVCMSQAVEMERMDGHIKDKWAIIVLLSLTNRPRVPCSVLLHHLLRFEEHSTAFLSFACWNVVKFTKVSHYLVQIVLNNNG